MGEEVPACVVSGSRFRSFRLQPVDLGLWGMVSAFRSRPARVPAPLPPARPSRGSDGPPAAWRSSPSPRRGAFSFADRVALALRLSPPRGGRTGVGVSLPPLRTGRLLEMTAPDFPSKGACDLLSCISQSAVVVRLSEQWARREGRVGQGLAGYEVVTPYLGVWMAFCALLSGLEGEIRRVPARA